MAKSKVKSITLGQAVFSFRMSLDSAHRSPNTIADYMNTMNKLLAHVDSSTPITTFTTPMVQQFLAAQTQVSKKTVLNYHTALSSFFNYLVDSDYIPANPIARVTRPKPEIREIIPFTQNEIKMILASLKTSRPYDRPGKRTSTHNIDPMLAQRNRAVILTLLDTGIRSNELCSATIRCFDRSRFAMLIMGKGDKERMLYQSPRTTLEIVKYLHYRDSPQPFHPLFATEFSTPFNGRYLGKLLERIAARAGVPDVHPHRFRHTFAITYLRNGGDIYTLQKMLGHSTLDMCKRYLAIAQVDVAAAHRRASPVDHWGL